MSNVATLGIDLAKNVFQLHGVDAHGKAVLRRRVMRDQLPVVLTNLPPCLIGMEACGGAHHFAREAQAAGHTRLFDKDYRMTRVTSDLPVSGTQPYFDRQISWDAQSRIGSLSDLANSTLSATYGYDALDRLTSASQGTSSWGYTYNGMGDRVTSTVGATSTTYTYFSATHRLQTLAGGIAKSYTYDAAGNTTSDGTTTWTYGGNGRPSSAGAVAFLINALGQRVRKSAATSTIRFVYDEAGRLWGEYDATGALVQETVWLEHLPVATLRPNGPGILINYVHPDHLGTPRAITRPSDNQAVWKWDNTEPFGNSSPNEDPNGLGNFAYNLRFPGQYYDAETGLHYNYFRDYDSSIGRYIESDPIGLKGGINTFGYANQNPLTLVDPHGLSACFNEKDCLDQAEKNHQKCKETYHPGATCTLAFVRCAPLRHPYLIAACLVSSASSCAASFFIWYNQRDSDRRLCKQGIPPDGYMPGDR